MRLRLSLLSVPLVLATGCSTIVHMDRPSGLAVTGRPAGAIILVDGVIQGQTAREPVYVAVEGGSGPHVVRVEKDGYAPQEFSVEKTTSDWVWGNAPFAVFPIVAAAGFGIDAVSGRWYRLSPNEIEVALSPVEASRKPQQAEKPRKPMKLERPGRESGGLATPSATEDSPASPKPATPPPVPGDGLATPPATEDSPASPKPATPPPVPDDGLAPPPVGDGGSIPFHL